MAQLDAQQVQIQFETVAVRKLIAEARENCAWVEEKHSIVMEVQEELLLNVDPSLIEKVITNLLENAGKYSREGTTITVTAERQGECIAISVADRGIGIDPAEQGLIFERFYRGRFNATGAPGTGMGLAISRAIVEAHGGRISVVSQSGQGSVFTVILPAAEPFGETGSRVQ